MGVLDIVQTVIGAFQAVATILIAAVLYRQAQSLKRIEVHSHAIEAYNLLNSVAVSSPENLVAFDTFGRPTTVDDDSSRRRRWCAFIWLEALQVTFTALKGKMIDEKYANQALASSLKSFSRTTWFTGSSSIGALIRISSTIAPRFDVTSFLGRQQRIAKRTRSEVTSRKAKRRDTACTRRRSRYSGAPLVMPRR